MFVYVNVEKHTCRLSVALGRGGRLSGFARKNSRLCSRACAVNLPSPCKGWKGNGRLTFLDGSGRVHGAHGHTFWLVGPTGVHGYKHQHLSVYRQGVWEIGLKPGYNHSISMASRQ